MSNQEKKLQFSDLVNKVLSGGGLTFDDISKVDVSTIPDMASLNKMGEGKVVSIPTPFGMAIGIGGQDDSFLDGIIKAQQEEINKLREANRQLQNELQETKAEKAGLQFPEDFTYSEDDSEDYADEQDIQDLIGDLEGIDVPLYSFAMIQHKDTVALKVHDDEGITYIVASGYYTAQPL